MYHFVKFNNTWYLKPESIQDIVDHFNKICGREFEQGFNDFKDNVSVRKSPIDGHPYLYSRNHSVSHWRNVVELEMKFKDKSWLDAACSLEAETYKDRIERFLKGKLEYFTDGLAYYPPIKEPTYDEEIWKEDLIYPVDYNYDEVRFIQWPDGIHWYAKIGNIDICDKYGNYKARDKYYMMEVAKKWCQCGGDWSKIKE